MHTALHAASSAQLRAARTESRPEVVVIAGCACAAELTNTDSWRE